MLLKTSLGILLAACVIGAATDTLQQGRSGYSGCVTTDVRDLGKTESLNEDGGANPNKITLADGG